MPTQRNIYLKMKTLADARRIVFDTFANQSAKSGEEVPVPDAVGRVLSSPVAARLSSPNFHSAAMDGIAVMAKDTFGATENRPKILQVGDQARFLNTGNAMPEGTNAVIMIENVNVLDKEQVQIDSPAFPWQNVRKMGEDIVATELLFPQNHVITPYCVGALLSAGIFSVAVRKKPQILILPTGTELVDWRDLDLQALGPGQVLETNSYVLGKLVESHGGSYT